MQCSLDEDSRQELVITQAILLGQHKLSQQLDCRVTFQAPMVSAKNSAEREKKERSRTPDAGRLMVKTTLMIDYQIVEQQVAQTQPGPCTREVADLNFNPVSEELGQTQERAQVNSQIGLHLTLKEQ
jgi:hypothetical protein